MSLLRIGASTAEITGAAKFETNSPTTLVHPPTTLMRS